MIIAAVAMFTAVAMAWDNDHKWNNTIHGEYAFTGAGNCLIAIAGFNSSLQPNNGASGMWFWGPITLDGGVIKFNKDGTGSVKDVLRAYDIWSPGFPPTQPPPDARSGNEI